MLRRVEPELLDTLPPDDPRAVHSRHDLRRVNALMRNDVIMVDALRENFSRVPQGLTELGAGDGNFLLSVAQKMASHWPDMRATLLDLQKNVSPETLAAFSGLGWQVETIVADVFDQPQITGDIVIANLFLHHFENERLAKLLELVSKQAALFIAVEPRRAAWPLFCSRLLGAIGCNEVTRHDAVVSVRAGFTGRELSTLWPDQPRWDLTESSTAAFSHLFVARRRI